MAPGRSAGRGPKGPKGPIPGSILTGMIVGQAKKGVTVELGSTELVLPRAKYGASADRIEGSMYGDALTVEVVADQSGPNGIGITRVGIERSMRQPRPIDGRLERSGDGFRVVPADGSDPFAVVVVDQADPDALVGADATWHVGAPHRGQRFALLDA